MTRFQRGYFNRRTGLLLTLFGLVVVFAFPKFGEWSDRKMVSEAFRLASDSQIRVSEFYSLSARFPQNETELRSVIGDPSDKPAFVSAVEVDSQGEDHDVVVRVYLDDTEVDSADGTRPVLYLTGNRSGATGQGLQWRCSASGLDVSVLPVTCSG